MNNCFDLVFNNIQLQLARLQDQITALSNQMGVIKNNLAIQGNLSVGGDSLLSGSVETGNLDVYGDLSVSGDSKLTGSVEAGEMTVTGYTRLEGPLVGKTIVATGTMAVAGDVKLPGNVSIGSNGSKFTQPKNLTLNGLVLATSGAVLIDPGKLTCAFSTGNFTKNIAPSEGIPTTVSIVSGTIVKQTTTGTVQTVSTNVLNYSNDLVCDTYSQTITIDGVIYTLQPIILGDQEILALVKTGTVSETTFAARLDQSQSRFYMTTNRSEYDPESESPLNVGADASETGSTELTVVGSVIEGALDFIYNGYIALNSGEATSGSGTGYSYSVTFDYDNTTYLNNRVAYVVINGSLGVTSLAINFTVATGTTFSSGISPFGVIIQNNGPTTIALTISYPSTTTATTSASISQFKSFMILGYYDINKSLQWGTYNSSIASPLYYSTIQPYYLTLSTKFTTSVGYWSFNSLNNSGTLVSGNCTLSTGSTTATINSLNAGFLVPPISYPNSTVGNTSLILSGSGIATGSLISSLGESTAGEQTVTLTTSATSNVSNSSFTGSGSVMASFYGNITSGGTVITVTRMNSGTIYQGMYIFGPYVTVGGPQPTQIASFGSGKGGVGDYSLSYSTQATLTNQLFFGVFYTTLNYWPYNPPSGFSPQYYASFSSLNYFNSLYYQMYYDDGTTTYPYPRWLNIYLSAYKYPNVLNINLPTSISNVKVWPPVIAIFCSAPGAGNSTTNYPTDYSINGGTPATSGFSVGTTFTTPYLFLYPSNSYPQYNGSIASLNWTKSNSSPSISNISTLFSFSNGSIINQCFPTSNICSGGNASNSVAYPIVKYTNFNYTYYFDNYGTNTYTTLNPRFLQFNLGASTTSTVFYVNVDQNADFTQGVWPVIFSVYNGLITSTSISINVTFRADGGETSTSLASTTSTKAYAYFYLTYQDSSSTYRTYPTSSSAVGKGNALTNTALSSTNIPITNIGISFSTSTTGFFNCSCGLTSNYNTSTSYSPTYPNIYYYAFIYTVTYDTSSTNSRQTTVTITNNTIGTTTTTSTLTTLNLNCPSNFTSSSVPLGVFPYCMLVTNSTSTAITTVNMNYPGTTQGLGGIYTGSLTNGNTLYWISSIPSSTSSTLRWTNSGIPSSTSTNPPTAFVTSTLGVNFINTNGYIFANGKTTFTFYNFKYTITYDNSTYPSFATLTITANQTSSTVLNNLYITGTGTSSPTQGVWPLGIIIVNNSGSTISNLYINSYTATTWTEVDTTFEGISNESTYYLITSTSNGTTDLSSSTAWNGSYTLTPRSSYYTSSLATNLGGLTTGFLKNYVSLGPNQFYNTNYTISFDSSSYPRVATITISESDSERGLDSLYLNLSGAFTPSAGVWPFQIIVNNTASTTITNIYNNGVPVASNISVPTDGKYYLLGNDSSTSATSITWTGSSAEPTFNKLGLSFGITTGLIPQCASYGSFGSGAFYFSSTTITQPRSATITLFNSTTPVLSNFYFNYNSTTYSFSTMLTPVIINIQNDQSASTTLYYKPDGSTSSLGSGQSCILAITPGNTTSTSINYTITTVPSFNPSLLSLTFTYGTSGLQCTTDLTYTFASFGYTVSQQGDTTIVTLWLVNEKTFNALESLNLIISGTPTNGINYNIYVVTYFYIGSSTSTTTGIFVNGSIKAFKVSANTIISLNNSGTSTSSSSKSLPLFCCLNYGYISGVYTSQTNNVYIPNFYTSNSVNAGTFLWSSVSFYVSYNYPYISSTNKQNTPYTSNQQVMYLSFTDSTKIPTYINLYTYNGGTYSASNIGNWPLQIAVYNATTSSITIPKIYVNDKLISGISTTLNASGTVLIQSPQSPSFDFNIYNTTNYWSYTSNITSLTMPLIVGNTGYVNATAGTVNDKAGYILAPGLLSSSNSTSGITYFKQSYPNVTLNTTIFSYISSSNAVTTYNKYNNIVVLNVSPVSSSSTALSNLYLSISPPSSTTTSNTLYSVGPIGVWIYNNNTSSSLNVYTQGSSSAITVSASSWVYYTIIGTNYSTWTKLDLTSSSFNPAAAGYYPSGALYMSSINNSLLNAYKSSSSNYYFVPSNVNYLTTSSPTTTTSITKPSSPASYCSFQSFSSYSLISPVAPIFITSATDTTINQITKQAFTSISGKTVTLSASNTSISVGQQVCGNQITENTYVSSVSNTTLLLTQKASSDIASSSTSIKFYTSAETTTATGIASSGSTTITLTDSNSSIAQNQLFYSNYVSTVSSISGTTLNLSSATTGPIAPSTLYFKTQNAYATTGYSSTISQIQITTPSSGTISQNMLIFGNSSSLIVGTIVNSTSGSVVTPSPSTNSALAVNVRLTFITPTATTTPSAAVANGSTSITVSSSSNIAANQLVYATPTLSSGTTYVASIPFGTIVKSISGNTVTLSSATTAALTTSSKIYFVTATTTQTGTASNSSSSVTLSSNISVAVNQLVSGRAGITFGTYVSSISGTALTLSANTTAALITLKFYNLVVSPSFNYASGTSITVNSATSISTSQKVFGNNIPTAALTTVSSISGTAITLSQSVTTAADYNLYFFSPFKLKTTASGTQTSASTTVTLSASNNSIQTYQLVYGQYIIPGTFVSAISGTSITLSRATTTSLGSSPKTLFFYSNGLNTKSTGTVSSGSTTITLTAPNGCITKGMYVFSTSSGIAADTTVSSISGTSLTLSKVTTAALSSKDFYFYSYPTNLISTSTSGSSQSTGSTITISEANSNIGIGNVISTSSTPGSSNSSYVSYIASAASTSFYISSSLSVSANSTLYFFPQNNVMVVTPTSSSAEIKLYFNSSSIPTSGYNAIQIYNTSFIYSISVTTTYYESSSSSSSSTFTIMPPVSTTQTTSSSTTTSGSTSITLSASNSQILVGQLVFATGIAVNTTVSAISGTSLTLSTATTASLAASTNLSFYYNSFFTQSSTITSNNTSSTLSASNSKILVGQLISATAGIAQGTYVSSISNTSLTLSTTASSSTSTTLSFYNSFFTQTTSSSTTTSGSTTITLSASNSQILVGQLVSAAAGIAQGTYVSAISGTTLTLSSATTATVNSSTRLTFCNTFFIQKTSSSNTASGSTSITLSASNSNIVQYQLVSAASGIAQGTYVSSISGTTLTLSTATTAEIASSTALSFYKPTYVNCYLLSNGFLPPQTFFNNNLLPLTGS